MQTFLKRKKACQKLVGKFGKNDDLEKALFVNQKELCSAFVVEVIGTDAEKTHSSRF